MFCRSTTRNTINTFFDIFNYKGHDWTFNKWYSYSNRYHEYMSKEEIQTKGEFSWFLDAKGQ